MGQVSVAPVLGFSVLPTDRESGPTAGPGATGNNAIFLGQNAGQNSTISQFIAIGNLAASGGITSASLNGSTIIGAQTMEALTQATSGVPAYTAANTVLGSANLNGVTKMDTSTIIGAGNLPAAGNLDTLSQCIIIGNANLLAASNAGGAAALSTDIIIGSHNFPQTTIPSQLVSLIMIGNNNAQAGAATNIAASQVIGSSVSITGSANANTVIIGDLTSIPQNTTNNVLVGYNCSSTSSSNGNNVIIGAAASASGDSNLVIGAQANNGSGGAGCVVLGPKAQTTASNALLIAAATTVGGTATALVFGNFSNGNMVLGNSVAGTNQDFGTTPGTNMLKLLNGSKATGTVPAGGGYFYVSAGVLHWVDANGVDNQLSVSASGQIGSSSVTLTNNAAAAAGTLTNAPVAGNPTKWAPYNDNGTIRNIPMW